jgi:hypothetical protein
MADGLRMRSHHVVGFPFLQHMTDAFLCPTVGRPDEAVRVFV